MLGSLEKGRRALNKVVESLKKSLQPLNNEKKSLNLALQWNRV